MLRDDFTNIDQKHWFLIRSAFIALGQIKPTEKKKKERPILAHYEPRFIIIDYPPSNGSILPYLPLPSESRSNQKPSRPRKEKEKKNREPLSSASKSPEKSQFPPIIAVIYPPPRVGGKNVESLVPLHSSIRTKWCAGKRVSLLLLLLFPLTGAHARSRDPREKRG